MAQKVITVNINVYEQTVTNRHSAYEISYVNRYLDDGWVIKEIIHSATAAANWTNSCWRNKQSAAFEIILKCWSSYHKNYKTLF